MAAAGLVAASKLRSSPGPTGAETEFSSKWQRTPDRVWIGAEYWANPLQDWRIAGGRLECTRAAPWRNVQLLTRDLLAANRGAAFAVTVGRHAKGNVGETSGSVGFSIGIRGPLDDYRNHLIFGTGLEAGVSPGGQLFIARGQEIETAAARLDAESIRLQLKIAPEGDRCRITLTALDPSSGNVLGFVEAVNIDPDELAGNIGLATNFSRFIPEGAPPVWRGEGKWKEGVDEFWFDALEVSGGKVAAHPEREFGAILFSQYTLSRGVLKLTAQMPPLGADDSQEVRLDVQEQGGWREAGVAKIHPEARTAEFRLESWSGGKAVPYRLRYQERFNDGTVREHVWAGTFQRDPVDQDEIRVADVSCNYHTTFPNAPFVAHMAALKPHLLAFVGDQFYESSGGYGTRNGPLDMAILDYLRKWYLHGWTWRELTRDIPSIDLPDDHDVYQGNIWGEGGIPTHGAWEKGGYGHDPSWVNVVHRTMTSHHPDPYDPAPIEQGISVFYSHMIYGGVSLAIIADRQFKSGPQGKVPPTGDRGDHVIDPNFDPKTADVPGLKLLGDRQLHFLQDWLTDWRGAEMKAVISQTIFTALPTTHGAKREVFVADYDTNGWPQTSRNHALKLMRKAFAFHLAGDQHLPAVVQYGVDEHGDAPVAFAGPAVNVGFQRWFEPKTPGRNRLPGAPANTGEFLDSFGNPMTVLAVANGAPYPRQTPIEQVQDKASGLGIVCFDKRRRLIRIECWPYLVDPTRPDSQFPGWPVTVRESDNYGRKPVAYLPRLRFAEGKRPALQVIDSKSGELVYTLRAAAAEFQPHVFAPGKYTVEVSDPDSGKSRRYPDLEALPQNPQILDVVL